MEEEEKKEYLNNLDLELHTQEDVESLLKEYEGGKLTREEYICCSWLSHSVTHSIGFKSGWNARDKNTIKKIAISKLIDDLMEFERRGVSLTNKGLISILENIISLEEKQVVKQESIKHPLCDKCGGEIRRKHIGKCPTDGKYYCEKCIDPDGKIYNEKFFENK